MRGKGKGYDTSAAETFTKAIKAELIWRRSCRTHFEYFNGFYNPRRRHSALGWKSPATFKWKVT